MFADTDTHTESLDHLVSQSLSGQNLSVECFTYCVDDSLPLLHTNFRAEPVPFDNQSRFPSGHVDRQVRGRLDEECRACTMSSQPNGVSRVRPGRLEL